MKLLDILRDANSNLLRSKVRTLLTIIAIFIGALTLTLTNGVGSGVSEYIDKQLGNLGAKDALIIQPKHENMGATASVEKYNPDRTTSAGAGGIALPVLNAKDIETIRAQKGILSAEPMLSATPEYITAGGEKYKVTLSPYIEGTNLDIKAGSTFSTNTSQTQIVLPIAFIGPLGFGDMQSAVGKQVKLGVKSTSGNIEEVTATVQGVQQQSIAGASGITVNTPLIKSLLAIQTRGLPDQAKNKYPAAVARFDTNISEKQLDAIKKELGDKGYQAMTVKDTIGIIKQIIGAITNILNFFAAIALLAASFGIINTLLMAVQERTKEIGLMKAMGLSSKKIFLLFSIEAVLLGFWGSLLGSLAGIGIGKIINHVASDTFLKDLPGFNLTAFPFTSTIVIMLIIMAIAFIAGTLPARRASQKDPIEALRYE